MQTIALLLYSGEKAIQPFTGIYYTPIIIEFQPLSSFTNLLPYSYPPTLFPTYNPLITNLVFTMAEEMKTLEDLFIHEMMDLYSAEKQIIEALPQMIEKAHNPKLKQGFEKHLEETKKQKERIEQMCEELDIPILEVECKGMKGVIAEGQEMLQMNAEPEVLDAALIIAAQRVEHYEIAGYGAAATHAKQLGYVTAMDMLLDTLEEEEQTDMTLSELAKAQVNIEADEEGATDEA